MKLIAALVIAIAACDASPTTAQVCDSGQVVHCAPVVVSTCEVDRCFQYRTAYDECGNPRRYRVAVVTYRSRYSDGSRRTFTRVYRA